MTLRFAFGTSHPHKKKKTHHHNPDKVQHWKRKWDEQHALNRDLENDMRLLHNKHKKELAELEEKYKVCVCVFAPPLYLSPVVGVGTLGVFPFLTLCVCALSCSLTTTSAAT